MDIRKETSMNFLAETEQRNSEDIREPTPKIFFWIRPWINGLDEVQVLSRAAWLSGCGRLVT